MFGPLGLSGYFMYHQVRRSKIVFIYPNIEFICFIWISEQTAVISIYSINWLVFITQKECLIFMDPCIVDFSAEIPTRYSFVIEFIIPKFFEGSTCFERHTL